MLKFNKNKACVLIFLKSSPLHSFLLPAYCIALHLSTLDLRVHEVEKRLVSGEYVADAGDGISEFRSRAFLGLGSNSGYSVDCAM